MKIMRHPAQMTRSTAWRERLRRAATVSVGGWLAAVPLTSGMGACCGVIFGAVIGIIFALSQADTPLGRVLMGLFDILMGSVAGGVFGAVAGAFFGAFSGGIVIPIRFALSVVYEPHPGARNSLDSWQSSEPIPAVAPCGRGDETAPAAGTIPGEP